jgi:hypothetical protein
MAVYTNQKVFLDQNLRGFAVAIFGAIPMGGGFQWSVGTDHPRDKNPGHNSAAINAALLAAGCSSPELVVVILEP